MFLDCLKEARQSLARMFVEKLGALSHLLVKKPRWGGLVGLLSKFPDAKCLELARQ